MRLLVNAIYDTPRGEAWRGDSCFLFVKYAVQAALDRGDFVTWVLPDMYQVPSHPRLRVLRFSFPENVPHSNLHQHYLNMARVAEEFPGAHGDRFIDAVLCNDAYHALMLREYFGARRFYSPPAVVHWHGYPTILDWSETNWVLNGDESPLPIRALGYCLADFISCCPYCSGRIYELVKAFAPPQAVARFLETRSEVMLGPDCDFIDGLDEPKNEKISLYWGGRFTATKGGERSVQQYLQLMMGGRDVEIYVTMVGGAQRLEPVTEKWGAQDAMHLMRDIPYEQAMRVMKRCHAAVFYQLNPGAAAPYEWLYGDVIVLFKRHHYAEELQMYPPEYPFLFDTEEECAAMLRWIAEDYPSAKKAFDDVGTREWVKDHCDKLTGCRKMVDLAACRAQAMKESEHIGPMEDARDLVSRTLAALEPPVSLPLLLEGMNRMSNSGSAIMRQWGGQGLIPHWIHRHLLPEGWHDTELTAVPEYVPADWVAAETVPEPSFRDGAH